MKEIKITFDHTGVKSVTEIETERNTDMKPFNLEEAKAGKPVCTRDGRKVRLLCFDAKSNNYPIVGLILSSWGNVEECKTWTDEGVYYVESVGSKEPHNDLFMAEETIEINGYKVPKPETASPVVGAPYFVSDPAATSLYYRSTWNGSFSDQRILAHGVIHLTKEAALKHAKALLSFTRKED